MGKLVAVSPVGKNGQTVVPAPIRKLFKVAPGHNLIGFYVGASHVEIAPISVVKEKVDYTDAELDRLERLSTARGGKKFKTGKAAKRFLKHL